MQKQYRVFFETLGCRLNYSETAIIAANFRANGNIITENLNEAELCVLHSCTVTAQSDSKCRQKISLFKKKAPQALIAVIGCYSQMDSQRIAKLGVAIILGNQEKMQLYDYFQKFLVTKKPIVNASKISGKSFSLPEQVRIFNQTRANLKIQDGCNFACSFCIIPFARGRARSRNFTDLLQEAKSLAIQGYKEIVLTGVNIGTYQDGEYNFIDVIDALEKINGIERIRISSIEPTTISTKIFAYMKDKDSKLLPFLHLPLQSGSNKILQAMRRRYLFQEYKDFVEEAYQKVPDICIGTDLIAGFPEESEQDFAEGYQNLEKLPLHFFHVFPFSARAGTRALNLEQLVPTKIQKRALQLRNLSQAKRQKFYQTQTGKIREVLFESSKNGLWMGYTDNYIRVQSKAKDIYKNFLGKVKINSVSNLLAQATLI